MIQLTFAQFERDIHALSAIRSTGKIASGFSPYLAFGLIYIQLVWTKCLNKWDSGLQPKLRPWIYLGIFLFFLAGLILPQWLANPKPNASAVSLVSIVPMVPLEPTWIPDTLITNSSFTKPTLP